MVDIMLLLTFPPCQVRCHHQPSHDFWPLNPLTLWSQVELNPYPSSSMSCNLFSAETARVLLSPAARRSPMVKMQPLILSDPALESSRSHLGVNRL